MIGNKTKKKLKRSLLAVAVSFASLVSQTSEAEENSFGYIKNVDPKARLAVFGVNAGVNAAVCGVTAAIEGRNILKDIGKCFIGGTVQYMGMEAGSYNNYFTPSIGLHLVETGTAVINNTLEGREPLEKLYHGFGPGLLEIDTKTGKFSLHWRLLPSVGLLTNIVRLNQLDLENSLRYDSFIFRSEHGAKESGLTLGNIITTNKDAGDYVMAHEFNHLLQYVRLRPAQEFIGSEWLDEKIKLRLGEDIVTGMFHSPMILCNIAKGDSNYICSRRYWNLLETEAYIMETANSTSLDDLK